LTDATACAARSGSFWVIAHRASAIRPATSALPRFASRASNSSAGVLKYVTGPSRLDLFSWTICRPAA
jgi:hypothetical protein